MKEFKDLKFKHRESNFGVQARLDFPNGYGVSVIKGQYSYGGPEGLYELAVMKNGSLCYTTPVTDDVEGHCDEMRITELMKQVQELPTFKASGE